MISYSQFNALILTPALTALQLDSLSLLVAGTIAHESKGATYLKQINGPALGPAMIEPATHDSIWNSYLPNQAAITSKLMILCQFSRAPKSSQMINDLLYSVCMCAILYKWRLDSHRESSPKTIEECAQVWKAYYNTALGKGTTDEYITDYREWTGTNKPRGAKAVAS